MKNFHLNYKQCWSMVGLQKYCVDEDLVINAESYEPEDQSFTFAARIKDEAPDSIWEGLVIQPNGWCIFEMDNEGHIGQEAIYV